MNLNRQLDWLIITDAKRSGDIQNKDGSWRGYRQMKELLMETNTIAALQAGTHKPPCRLK